MNATPRRSLDSLTRAEKETIALGDLAAVEGVVPFAYSDGGNGVRDAPGATAFPSSLSTAATFDRDLATRYGATLAAEVKAAGRNALLGPALDIARVPFAGRQGESFGEDPFLTGQIAGAVIEGIQANNVMSIAKHYVANNFEAGRTGAGSFGRRTDAVDVRIDERTLRELYLAPFRHIVEKHRVAGLMGSYNRLNGDYVCQSADLLDIPRRDWGWNGVYLPDFLFAVRDDAAALRAGLDLPALGGAAGRTAAHVAGLEDTELDGLVSHVLDAAAGVDLAWPSEMDADALGTKAALLLAEQLITAGSVLLSNDGCLPLADRSRIALIGDASHLLVMGGSAAVEAPSERILSVAAALGDAGFTVVSETGSLGDVSLPALETACIASIVDSETGREVELELQQFELVSAPEGIGDDWSAVVTATVIPRVSGPHRLALHFTGEASVLIDGTVVASGFREASPMIAGPIYPLHAMVNVEAGVPVSIELRFDVGPAITIPPLGIGPKFTLGFAEPDDAITRATEAARHSDAAVVVVGRVFGEAMDVESLRLPSDQEALIEAVVSANPRTVVVVVAGGPIVMPWAARAGAVLHVWTPGERFAPALASMLGGVVEPGGRLPVSIPRCDEDARLPQAQYPGIDGRAIYDDGLEVGYRRYAAQAIEPAFGFGHGLGYAEFDLSEIAAGASQHDIRVSGTLANTSGRGGKSVLLAFVSRPGERTAALRGFTTLWVDAGTTQRAEIDIPIADLRRFDEHSGEWILDPGDYTVQVGFSITDLHSTFTIAL